MKETMLEQIFIGLSNKHRLYILRLLKDSAMSVDEIASNIELTKATISYHLKVLRMTGLVTTKKKKNNVFYSLNSKCIDALHKWLQEFIEKGGVL